VIDRLTEFFWDNCEYRHERNFKSEFKKVIEKHLEYKTLVYLESDCGIVGACRFNINNDTAEILDIAVDKRYRNKDMLQRMLQIGKRLYPMVTKLSFHSEKKDKDYIYAIGGNNGR
jgi:hypothetical protein